MADKYQAQPLEELGEGFEFTDEIPDEALENISGGAISECRCPNCGNTEEAYISGPNGYYVRYCKRCGTSWPYWI